MGNEIYLTSPIPPSVNHYLSYRIAKMHGKYIPTSYITKETKDYKKQFSQYVLEQAKQQGWDLQPNRTQHFYCDVVFYFSRIDNDANNYYKVMLDAITDTQSIWLDDNVVCERTQGIYYDSENPRLEIHIFPVDYIGVFKDALQLDLFIKNNCVGCSRYKKNCTFLSNAQKGKIQEGFNTEICKKKK